MRPEKLSKPLVKPLRAAFEASGMTMSDLIAKAGLDITQASMSRKLLGTQGIGIDNGEAEALGKVFGLRLEWAGREFRYRKDGAGKAA